MLFARLPCSVLCLKLSLLFQFQFMVRNLREGSVCNLISQYWLSNLERWALNEHDFNAIFLFTEVKAAEAEVEVEMEVVM